MIFLLLFLGQNLSSLNSSYNWLFQTSSGSALSEYCLPLGLLGVPYSTSEMQRLALLRQKYSRYTDSLLSEMFGGH